MSKRLGANSTFARSIDSIGWALFFMWVGIALLAHVDVDVGMMVRGQRTHAMEGGHTDLHAAHSDLVEEQG